MRLESRADPLQAASSGVCVQVQIELPVALAERLRAAQVTDRIWCK